jgi:hypothetical protein
VALPGYRLRLRRKRFLDPLPAAPARLDIDLPAGFNRFNRKATTYITAAFAVAVLVAGGFWGIKMMKKAFSKARFKQVSNSRVAGDDYETLDVTFGDETPTAASTGKDNAGNAVQNVIYRPSGVIVDVVAKVLGSGRVKLQLDGQISSFKPTSTGVIGSPILIKRQVKTTITVANGEVQLIGGLNDSQAVNSSSSLPFLPATWGGKSSNTLENDLVLILSATTR